MKNLLITLGLCTTVLGALAAQARDVPLPARDLTVELRQLQEGSDLPGHYTAGTDTGRAWEAQTLQLRNGETAQLRMHEAIPMQWTQAVGAQGISHGGGAGSGGSKGSANAVAHPNTNSQAGVSQALVWFDAGQSLSVQARWPGGSKPVVLFIEVQRAALAARSGADLPAQLRNTVSTTLTIPLAEWVTVAASGKPLKPGVYRSDAGELGRRLLQVRVMAP